ncbi:uncharacterized protein LOC125232718 [Leguminivora glycinivorella]|uniref:uncharacterized protein LOC125232718 n=1 Tax=Leguminivora glycinivorella TaxID=1035111 RepID=UPI00200DB61A|nr:uncharacterized protein LOC125232718 [Leguminivora glycinivorella]
MVFKVIAFLGLLAVANAMVNYENYKVYNVMPKSEAEVQMVNDLKKDGYEFWTEIFEVGSEVRIMVAPDQDEEFSSYVKSVNLDAIVSIANVQELIDAQLKTAIPNADSRSSTLGGMSWDRYYSLESIYNWLDELETLYPNVVTTVSLGNTFEGRPIRCVIIDFKSGDRGERPLTAMIEAGIHAREWIAPATATWIIKEFLTSNDPEVRSMAETFVWHIIPVANPDGYVYTFTNDRMWRKNRNRANHVMCGTNADAGNGIDLNRNFNFQWMVTGASSNPCDQTYAGPSAASERETQAISNYVIRLDQTSELIYYIDFHSYSQMVLVPYSHVSGIDVLQAPNYGDMFEVAIRAAEKLEARHGTRYTVGTSQEILYAVTGSSFDWVKGVVNVPIVYLFELRDVGLYGFLLPPEDIIPNNEEIMDAFLEMDRVTRQLGYYSGTGVAFSSFVSLVVSACLLVLLFRINTVTVIKSNHTYLAEVIMVFKVIALLGLLVVANAMVNYENYKVYNVMPKSEAEVQMVNDLKKDGYEFWTEIFEVGSEVRIMVAPDQDEEFSSYVKSVNLDAIVSIANVQELIDAQLKTAIPNADSRSSTLGGMSWDRYYSLESIYNWLDELETLYPNVVTTVSLGNTFEGRPIRCVIIDFKSGDRGERPLTAMIEAGIHAREWIAPATATWIIKEFLTSNDPEVRSMAETFVWHIIPVANPDGYVYSFTNDRMWRKNRNRANHVMCGTNADAGNGIDLNRNFNFQWMVTGASSNPCDRTYAGPSAASERETQAISNYVIRLDQTSELIYYIDFHSYSQMVLVPYSHVSGIDVLQAPNYGDMFEVAIRAAEKLEARHGTRYTVGTSQEILYAVSGSSFDWVKGVVNVPIVYLFELRDVGLYGFLLPPEDIIPNNEEIMDAFLEMDRVTRQLGYYSGTGVAFSSFVSLVVSACLLVLLQ